MRQIFVILNLAVLTLGLKAMADPVSKYHLPETALSFQAYTTKGPDAGIVAVVDRCVSEQGRPAKVEAVCAGLISSACPTGIGSTSDIVACLNTELRFWTDRMEAAEARLSALLKQEDADADSDFYPANVELVAIGAQMRWKAFTNQWCAYEHARFRGGSLGRITSADCLKDKTAYRATELENAIENHEPN